MIIDIHSSSHFTHFEKLLGEGNQGKKNLKIYGNWIDLTLKKYVEIEDGGCTIRITYRFYNIHESSLKGHISIRSLATQICRIWVTITLEEKDIVFTRF